MKIAINGAGVGGPTLAYWLKKYGHEPIIFEHAEQLRTDGFVVDFWGLGYQVAERSGIIDALREKAREMEYMTFVDANGERACSLDTGKVRARWNGRFITVPRGVICAEMFKACGDIRAEFGVHITGIRDSKDAVEATLSDGRKETFDAIVGADGLHSAVRDLVFGPEENWEVFMDCYVAAYRVANYPHADPQHYMAHSIPNKWIARIQRYDGATVILLIFRAGLIDGNPKREDVNRVLRSVYADVGWEAQEMLSHLDDGPVYFDRVSQIHLPTWHKGRVGLIGDAAACASLLAGEGTGLAMTEAYVLAGELHRAHGDVELAFQRYHEKLARFVRREQKKATAYRSFFAPTTRLGVRLRNLLVRVSSLPGMTAIIAGRTVPPFEFEEYQ